MFAARSTPAFPVSYERRLAPLPPPVSSAAGEECKVRPGSSESYTRNVLRRPSLLSRSSHRKPRRNRGAAQLGSYVEQGQRTHSASSSRPPKQVLPSLNRKSGMQPPKVAVFRDGEFQDFSRACPGSAPPGSVYLDSEEDLSPSMRMFQELKHAMSLPRLPGVQPEDEEEAGPSPELSSWMSATLASLPSKRSGLLPPLKDTAKTAHLEHKEKLQKATAAKPEQASRTKTKERRSSGEALSDLPSAAEVLERLISEEEGFSRSEMLRMTSTFRRFTVPGRREVKVEDLRTIMQHLGYMMTDEDTITQLLSTVTHNATLDQREFISFAEKMTLYEHRKFQEIFDTFDEDGSGRLDLSELRKFMVAIGFTPLRAMMREAMALVNVDGADTLGFKEMLHFLAIYRHTEGFTNKELKDLHSLFSEAKCDDADELPPHLINDVLRGFYGPQASAIAKQVADEVSGKFADQDDRQTCVLGMKLPETLIWARRLREAEIQVWREKFMRYDKDGSNSMDLAELQPLMAELGYTVTSQTIKEAMQEAEDEYSGKKEGHLDFDEFVNIVYTFRSRDGFSKAEVSELKETFGHFNKSGSQEVEAQSLCALLRYMGHVAWVDEVQQLMSLAKIDPNGAVDFRHFLWFMRCHREEELRKARHVFQKYEEKTLTPPGMQVLSLPAALEELGYQLRGPLQQGTAQDSGALNFDRFVDAVDACRATRVAEQRRCAGFSDSELEHFRQLFSQFDAEGQGHIGLHETGALLEELGFTMKTPLDRERFLTSIEKARVAARKVGVETVEAFVDGQLGFWLLVQLLRVLLIGDEKSAMDREAKAIAYTGFGQREVNDFKEIFTKCLEEAQLIEGDESDDGQGSAAAKELTKEHVCAVLRSLGMVLDAKSRQRLGNKIDELNSMGRVDFADFLRLMQWMLETNFADIQGNTAQVVEQHEEQAVAA